jgi:general secretion pathway protein K
MIDWTDGDNLARLNGAENDYYQSLNPSYNAKNGPIDVVEELLLVKGMTPDYFYGYPERDAGGSIIYKYGLYKYLTTYSGSNFMVNANAAPIPVLLSISGMTQEMAKAIYERRRTQPFKDKQELANFASNLDINALNRLSVLSPIQSNIYCLTASAHAENSKIRRIVRAVVSLDSFGNDAGYRILYWNENVPDYEGANQ